LSNQGLLLTGLETAINRCLRLDPELEQGVAELQGTVVEIHLEGLADPFQLHPGPAGVTVVGVPRGDSATVSAADLSISGPPFSLLGFFMSASSHQGILPEGVSVSGELVVIQRLRDLARRAHFDWEEPLSKLVGDSLAHEIGRGARGVLARARHAGDTLLMDIGEYLSEERRVAPTELEIDDFAARVDRLRDDVERLEVRVARVSRSVEAGGR
jgi:ubiquinone biosynthesis protein UbiJ